MLSGVEHDKRFITSGTRKCCSVPSFLIFESTFHLLIFNGIPKIIFVCKNISEVISVSVLQT